MLGILANVRIQSLCTMVSKYRMPVEQRLAHLMTEKRAKRVIVGTGVSKLSIVEDGLCASDLCVGAAERLFSETSISKSEIGAVVFVSQKPDYPVPATAFSIQSRLGLGTDVLAFDVNSSCPGFVYGLYITSSMLSNLNKKVLLCCGDVTSPRNVTNPNDSAFMAIMGDGIAVAVVENVPQENGRKIYYNIESYGDKLNVLYEPRGRARGPRHTDAEGNIILEKENYTLMDGMAIADFTLQEVPRNINNLLDYVKIRKDDLDIAMVHQANGLIVNSLAEKLGMSNTQMPFKCDCIGNTDMASISICMTELKKDGADYTKYHKVLLSGFGAGLSVASMIMDLSDIKILPTGEI